MKCSRIGGNDLDKKILEEYIDACEMIKETEQELKKLEKKKTPVILGKVKGSNQNFPYQERSFTIYGTESDLEEDPNYCRKKKILEERKKKAESIKLQVEEWMNEIPMRMQRIIKYKILEDMTWEETAAKIGRKTTENGLKKNFKDFLKNNKSLSQMSHMSRSNVLLWYYVEEESKTEHTFPH